MRKNAKILDLSWLKLKDSLQLSGFSQLTELNLSFNSLISLELSALQLSLEKLDLR